jgi:hypothetical protein
MPRSLVEFNAMSNLMNIEDSISGIKEDPKDDPKNDSEYHFKTEPS